MFSIMCETLSASASSGLPASPIAMIAIPAKIENNHDLQDLAVGEGFEQRGRHEMIDEILDRERLRRNVGGRRAPVAASPIWPMPTTSVERTKGPMIILMSLRKTVLISDIYLATSAAVALSGKE